MNFTLNSFTNTLPMQDNLTSAISAKTETINCKWRVPPSSLTVTTLKPDVVIVDNKKNEVVLSQLTNLFKKNINTQNKYTCLTMLTLGQTLGVTQLVAILSLYYIYTAKKHPTWGPI